MTNTQIAVKFAEGKTSGKSGTMFIDGDTIYSYGYHFPIATRINDNLYLFNKDGYSSTTGRHKAHVLQAISSGWTDVIEAVQDGRELKIDIKYLLDTMQEWAEKKTRSRKEWSREWCQREADKYDHMATVAKEYQSK